MFIKDSDDNKDDDDEELFSPKYSHVPILILLFI
jgi:hypothetical protein